MGEKELEENDWIWNAAHVSLHLHASSILVLNGLNFSEWCEQVQFHLGALDLDSALQTEKPAALTNESTDEEKVSIRPEKTNTIKTTLPKAEIANEFLKNIEDHFKSADKSLAGTLMAELTTKKFNGRRSVHEHVLEMANLAAKLKALGMDMDEFFLVQFILNSLPPQYEAFQINYNTIKDK
ncbi:uncharacterized protein LOC112171438 [Rosa chinensis]|uniref:uncharacterized protein LOC112171438 n=1 Tax=Rosa chinensis TaxID=74649 RepID=UPI000D08E2E2|nr:uncharacterized protein LOC112171438 [Rosa chinensis]